MTINEQNNHNVVVALPFDTNEYCLDDCDLFCTCGHYVNGHSNGLGGGLSICEEECGCCYCDLDVGFTVMMEYFQGVYENWYIHKLTTDAKRFWTMGNHGMPVVKEAYQMTLRRESKS